MKDRTSSLDSGVGCRCTVTPEAGRLACRRDPPVALQSLYGQGWAQLSRLPNTTASSAGHSSRSLPGFTLHMGASVSLCCSPCQCLQPADTSQGLRIPAVSLGSGPRASSCDDGGATWFFSSCGGILAPPVLLGFPWGSDGKESACDVGDVGYIPGLVRSPGGRLRSLLLPGRER